ncbi:hypothetical protein DITRI_Ditri14bG0121900 [Diplodiscus trichospermus]
MSAWTSRARQAANLPRFSSTKSAYSTPQAATLIHRRGLAGRGGGTLLSHLHHHFVSMITKSSTWTSKVNFWQDPLSPSKWKEEHFVIVSLTGWGLLFYGGYKYFIRDKKEEKKVEIKMNNANAIVHLSSS